MDSLENPLRESKYYRLETGQLAQYIGLDDRKKNHLFESKNGVGVKNVLRKTPLMIINNPPIPDNNEDGYGTDTEGMDDPWNLNGGRKTRKNKTRTRNKSKKFD